MSIKVFLVFTPRNPHIVDKVTGRRHSGTGVGSIIRIMVVLHDKGELSVRIVNAFDVRNRHIASLLSPTECLWSTTQINTNYLSLRLIYRGKLWLQPLGVSLREPLCFIEQLCICHW